MEKTRVLVKNVNVFVDNEDNIRLVVSENGEHIPGMVPFMCNPAYSTSSLEPKTDKLKRNNLYYMVINGGTQLTERQRIIIRLMRNRIINRVRETGYPGEYIQVGTHALKVIESYLNKHKTEIQIQRMRKNNSKTIKSNSLQR